MTFIETDIYEFEEAVLSEARRRDTSVIGMQVPVGPDFGCAWRPAVADYVPAHGDDSLVPGWAFAIAGLCDPGELKNAAAGARFLRPIWSSVIWMLALREQATASVRDTIRGHLSSGLLPGREPALRRGQT